MHPIHAPIYHLINLHCPQTYLPWLRCTRYGTNEPVAESLHFQQIILVTKNVTQTHGQKIERNRWSNEAPHVQSKAWKKL